MVGMRVGGRQLLVGRFLVGKFRLTGIGICVVSATRVSCERRMDPEVMTLVGRNVACVALIKSTCRLVKSACLIVKGAWRWVQVEFELPTLL